MTKTIYYWGHLHGVYKTASRPKRAHFIKNVGCTCFTKTLKEQHSWKSVLHIKLQQFQKHIYNFLTAAF